MTRIEIDLFMLYHVYMPLFGFALAGAFAIGVIVGIRGERNAELERRKFEQAFWRKEDEDA